MCVLVCVPCVCRVCMCGPQPFRRAHDEVLRVMEIQGKGTSPAEYVKVREIQELFVVRKENEGAMLRTQQSHILA